jgi:hypothetical protein
MTTANDITDGAYRKIGINSPTSTQDTEALSELNDMISLWGADLAVPYITRESDTLTIGTAEYTIGSGGDLDTVRPVSISSCYLVDTENYSYPVKIRGAEDYNRISSKTLKGRPRKLYYIPEYPLAKIIFSSEPDIAYTVNYEFWKTLTEFSAIDTPFSFPPEYRRAMIYNLAVALAENNSITISQTVIATAMDSYRILKKVSAMSRPPPIAQFDFKSGVPSNITTDK